MPDRIVVCIADGCHPVSGREAAGQYDASAVELALRTGKEVTLLHVGHLSAGARADFLGLGIGKLTELAIAPGEDIIQPLACHIRALNPEIVLAGSRAAMGRGSGMVPFLIAKSLSMPILAEITEIEFSAGITRAYQYQPWGKRRVWESRVPFAATIGRGGPRPRPFTYRAMRAGRMDTLIPAAAPATEKSEWRSVEYRDFDADKIRHISGGVEARLARLFPFEDNKTRTRQEIYSGPDEAAEAVLDLLREKQLF